MGNSFFKLVLFILEDHGDVKNSSVFLIIFSLALCFVVDFGIHKICFWWTFSLRTTFCTSPCNQCPDELSF